MKKAGADPAVSSAPFVATLVDVTGLDHLLFNGLYIPERHFALSNKQRKSGVLSIHPE